MNVAVEHQPVFPVILHSNPSLSISKQPKLLHRSGWKQKGRFTSWHIQNQIISLKDEKIYSQECVWKEREDSGVWKRNTEGKGSAEPPLGTHLRVSFYCQVPAPSHLPTWSTALVLGTSSELTLGILLTTLQTAASSLRLLLGALTRSADLLNNSQRQLTEIPTFSFCIFTN